MICKTLLPITVFKFLQKYEEFWEWQNLFLCVGKKGASVIMLGIALIGQHHVGRGIKCRLVQYCISGHKVGIAHFI